MKPNAHGTLSIDFADPLAVKALNAALLKQYYQIIDWDIPEGALYSPVPGRADYIHYIAELLGIDDPSTRRSETPSTITLLDIGTGANGIYPLLACQIYGWQCVGSDINTRSLENVATIIDSNPTLKGRFTLRTQHDRHHIFDGIIHEGEFFDVSVCNPPFHASPEEALKSSQRKFRKLARPRREARNAAPYPQFWWRRRRALVQGRGTTLPEKNDHGEPGIFNPVPLVYQPGLQNRPCKAGKKMAA